MTPEPPPRPVRRSRPDPGFRRRALGAPASGAPHDQPAGAPPARESFRAALSRIPDLDEPAAAPSSPAAAGVVVSPPPIAPETPPRPDGGPLGRRPAGSRALVRRAEAPAPARPDPDATAAIATPVSAPEPVSAAPDDAIVADPDAAGPGGRTRARTSVPPRPPWWRRAAFAIVLIALVAAIPGLGYAGYHLVSQSTDGKAGPGAALPSDPGYEELVASTPTALLIQNDAQGVPVNLTFLSLAAKGGSVIFLPLDTTVPEPAFGVDRLRSSYSMVQGGHAAGVKQVVFQTASVLNVGIDEVFELDDAGWSRLVAPVAPLKIFNTDPLDLNGTSLPSGDTSVPADLVGPYLAATREGEDDTSRFPRQQELLRSWFAAVAASTRADAVPGETGTGLGLFARTLAAGEVTFNTVPGAFVTFGPHPLYVPDKQALKDLVAEAVPAPDPAYPGSRTTVRLLNGVAAAPIPNEVTRKIVEFGGSVSVVGNGPAFGTDETSIIYVDPAKKPFAELLLKTLGAKGTVRRDPQAPDNVDLTVILGRDLLGDQVATTTTSAPGGQPAVNSSTTTTTTAPSGGT